MGTLTALLSSFPIAAQNVDIVRLDAVPSPDCMLAWDGARQQVLALERGTATGLWQWNGQRWARVLGAGDAPERRLTAYHDSIRGEFVAAGFGASRFDGRSWRVETEPQARDIDLLVFDAGRDRVLRQRYLQFAPAPISEWNGTTWQPLPPGPVARILGAMAYDATSQRVVLYGGIDVQSTLLADCWSYDGVAWTQVSASAPPGARGGASMAHDPSSGSLVLYGSFQRPFETWLLNGTTWTQAQTAANPGTRMSPNLAWDGQGILLHGTNYPASVIVAPGDASTWRFENGDWTRLVAAPMPRIDGAMAFDRQRQELVLWGGSAANRTWSHAGGAWRESAAITTVHPPIRSFPGMAWSAINGATLMHGGYSFGSTFSDTWLWDGTTWTQQTPTTVPPTDSSAVACEDPRGGVLLLTGATGQLAQHYWNGASWQQETPPPLPPSYTVTAGFDPVRGRVLLTTWPLSSPAAPLAYEWDGGQWSPVTLPAGLGVPIAIVFRPATARLLLQGLERWEWDGTTFFGPLPATNPVSAPMTITSSFVSGDVYTLPSQYVPANFRLDLGLVTTTLATAERYGSGCAAGAAPALTLHGRSSPNLPAAEVVAQTGAAFAPAAIAIGLQPSNLPIPGSSCVLHTGATIGTFITATDTAGVARLQLSVPTAPQLLGLEAFFQGAAVNPPNSTFAGITLTSGLRVTIGR